MRLIPALGLSILLAVSVSAAPKQDGIISQGEYAHTASFGDGNSCYTGAWARVPSPSASMRNLPLGGDRIRSVTIMDKAT
jgi:hypothetical protein